MCRSQALKNPARKKRCGGALGEMVQEAIAWDFASLSSTFVRDDLIKDYEGKRERERDGAIMQETFSH